MSSELTGERREARGSLWFGLLGGGVAWLVHLIAAWLIAEFGCIAAAEQPPAAYVSTTAMLLIGATALCLAAAVAATVAGYRAERRVREDGVVSDERLSFFMARGGAISSGLFAFIIVVQSVPIFYFLDHC